jgi:hypothetical protein
MLYFLQGHHLLQLTVHRLPYDTVRTLTQLLHDLVLLQNVGLYFFSHL